MIKRLIPFAALAACTQTVYPDRIVSGPCAVDDQVRMRFAGMRYVSRMRDELGRQTRSPVVRVVRPGEVMTMEYRADRLSVELDDSDMITGLRCG